MGLRYKFDPHVHTNKEGKSGRISTETLIGRYCALGYQGIAITNHLNEKYVSKLACADDWAQSVNAFLAGYRGAKELGDKMGLDVILGMELRFPENDNDYLIYGFDEAFLQRNPYLYRMGHAVFFDTFGKEVLIIHAHPFRDNNQVVYHESVHGVEIANCCARHENCNEQALRLCKENPHLYRLCGSDARRDGEEGHAWILFDTPIRNSFDFKSAVERGGYTLNCIDECEQKIIKDAETFFRAGGAA